METLRRLWQAIRNFFANAPNLAAIPPDSADPANAGESPQDAARQAASEIFAPRHSAHERFEFTAVEPHDVVGRKRQEFFREGSGFHEVNSETRVVTTPGTIVPPEAIILKCSHCGGFDSETHLCQCGRAVCRVCKRELIMPNGKAQSFCPEHFRMAQEHWNSWQAYDQGRKI